MWTIKHPSSLGRGSPLAMMLLAALLWVWPNGTRAAVSGEEEAAAEAEAVLLSEEALIELVGPIALYPDDLAAVVLPKAS